MLSAWYADNIATQHRFTIDTHPSLFKSIPIEMKPNIFIVLIVSLNISFAQNPSSPHQN